MHYICDIQNSTSSTWKTHEAVWKSGKKKSNWNCIGIAHLTKQLPKLLCKQFAKLPAIKLMKYADCHSSAQRAVVAHTVTHTHTQQLCCQKSSYSMWEVGVCGAVCPSYHCHDYHVSLTAFKYRHWLISSGQISEQKELQKQQYSDNEVIEQECTRVSIKWGEEEASH